MKKFLCLCLILSCAGPGFSQPPAPVRIEQAPMVPPRPLTKFDLDFRGGTPGELVAAIEKAIGRSLNAIVPVEYAGRKLPPLKMKNVTAAELFHALQTASQMKIQFPTGGGFQYSTVQYGFRNAGNRIVDDDTVWFFYVEGEISSPKVTRFYLLTPYLDSGLTVDDITTAIQTGWRMRGDAATPTLSFHKETKLLIAVGDYAGLDVIGDVLKALDGGKVAPSAAPADKSAEQRKTKQ